MQHEFCLGMKPLKCEKQTQIASAFHSTFRRLNISLASCSPAELASVSVQAQISNESTIFKNCRKKQPLSQVFYHPFCRKTMTDRHAFAFPVVRINYIEASDAPASN